MAFTPCTSLLAANVATACNAPRIKGYEQIGIIVNRADIDWDLTVGDALNPRIINSVTLKEGKKVSVIYNSKKNPLPFNGTQTAYNRDANQYDKTVQFYFEGIGAGVSKTVVEPLKDGDYVVILERKDKNGLGSFPVFGFQKGLSCGNDGGAQVCDEETGYWLMTMTTQEPYAEISAWDDDGYLDGKAAFDALVAKAY